MAVAVTTFTDVAALVITTIAAHTFIDAGIIIIAKTILAVIQRIVHTVLVGFIATIAFNAVAFMGALFVAKAGVGIARLTITLTIICFDSAGFVRGVTGLLFLVLARAVFQARTICIVLTALGIVICATNVGAGITITRITGSAATAAFTIWEFAATLSAYTDLAAHAVSACFARFQTGSLDTFCAVTRAAVSGVCAGK